MRFTQNCYIFIALNSTLWRSTYYRSAFVLYFLFQVTCTFICFKFIHSGDLYSASSRDYYSEALPAQSRTKNKDVVYIVLFVELKLMFYINFKLCFGRKSFQSESLFTWICQFCSERKVWSSGKPVSSNDLEAICGETEGILRQRPSSRR